MTAIVDIEGIGPVYAGKLKDAGISTVEKLLEAGATPKGRKELAAKVGISGDLLLEWVNHADLYRINGVGQEYADLLEAGGVDTVVELSHRKAENLHAAMAEMNEKKKLVRQMPSLAMVTAWIEEAKTLPRVVSY